MLEQEGNLCQHYIPLGTLRMIQRFKNEDYCLGVSGMDSYFS